MAQCIAETVKDYENEKIQCIYFSRNLLLRECGD